MRSGWWLVATIVLPHGETLCRLRWCNSTCLTGLMTHQWKWCYCGLKVCIDATGEWLLSWSGRLPLLRVVMEFSDKTECSSYSCCIKGVIHFLVEQWGPYILEMAHTHSQCHVHCCYCLLSILLPGHFTPTYMYIQYLPQSVHTAAHRLSIGTPCI